MSGPEIRPQLGQVQGCLNGQHLELCFLTDLLALQPTAASPIPLVPGGGSPVVLTAAAAFSPGQAKALTTDQIPALTSDQINALGLRLHAAHS